MYSSFHYRTCIFHFLFQIRGLDTEFCLDTKNKVPVNEGVELTMYKCHGMGGNQVKLMICSKEITSCTFPLFGLSIFQSTAIKFIIYLLCF